MEFEETIQSITSSWSQMSLTEEKELEKVQLVDNDFEAVDTGGRPSLVGKLLTSKSYKKHVLISYLKLVWDLTGWVRFKDIMEDSFLIQFENGEDKEKVLEEGPWLFSKSLFLTKHADGRLSQESVQIRSVSLWVQIFGLPPLGFTDQVGRKIGAKIGEVERVDETKKASWKGGAKGLNYMRVRIRMDIYRRLLRGSFLQHGEKQHWVTFRYDRLPIYCHGCGRLGHVVRDCSELATTTMTQLQYGEWLKVNSDVKSPFLGGDGDLSKQAGKPPEGAIPTGTDFSPPRTESEIACLEASNNPGSDMSGVNGAVSKPRDARKSFLISAELTNWISNDVRHNGVTRMEFTGLRQGEIEVCGTEILGEALNEVNGQNDIEGEMDKGSMDGSGLVQTEMMDGLFNSNMDQEMRELQLAHQPNEINFDNQGSDAMSPKDPLLSTFIFTAKRRGKMVRNSRKTVAGRRKSISLGMNEVGVGTKRKARRFGDTSFLAADMALNVAPS